MQSKYVLCLVVATVVGATYSSTRCSGGHCPATNPSDENLVLIQRQVSRHTNQACPPKPGTQCQGNDVLVPVWPPPYTSTAEECADLCSNNDKCQAYTFNNGPDGHQGVVEDGKFQCWLKDKCEPLSNDPLATSGVCTADPSASGDPHLINTRGEQFTIMKAGKMEFIRVPYESTSKKANLTVSATIEDMSGEGGGCSSLKRIASIRVGGLWLGERVLVVTMDGPDLSALLDGDQLLPSPKKVVIGGGAYLHHVDDDHLGIGFTHSDHALNTWIGVSHDGQFLNMQTRSLSKLDRHIGGILGEDDHTAISTRSPGCDVQAVLVSTPRGEHSYAYAVDESA